MLLTLATALHPRVAFYLSSPISSVEFKRLPERQRRSLKNPQYCGFEACMRHVVSNLNKPGLFFQAYCDSSEEYSVECLKLYHKMRKRDADFKRKCLSLTFAEDQHFAPLQAADMVAYCERANKTRHKITPEPILDQLLEVFRQDGSRLEHYVYRADGAGLGNAERET